MHGLEARVVDVGVDLRGVDVAVTQKFLDDAEVRPAAEKVTGETVPQYMGGNRFQQPAPAAVFLDQHPQGDALQGFSRAREEGLRALGVVELGPILAQISGKRVDGRFSHWND